MKIVPAWSCALLALVVPAAASAQTSGGDWAGFYAGVNAGAEWGETSFATDPRCPGSADATFCEAAPSPSAANGTAVARSGTGNLSSTGFAGGVQAGYNWQAGTVVYGAEVDFGAFDFDKSAARGGVFPFPFLGTDYTVAESAKADWLATLRARLGLTVTPGLLLYATGGIAVSELKFTSSYADNAIDMSFPGGTGFGSKSDGRVGWTIGGGGEWQLPGDWSIKAEYLYVDLGSMTVSVPTSNTAAFTQTIKVDADLTAHMARIGLNHGF